MSLKSQGRLEQLVKDNNNKQFVPVRLEFLKDIVDDLGKPLENTLVHDLHDKDLTIKNGDDIIISSGDFTYAGIESEIKVSDNTGVRIAAQSDAATLSSLDVTSAAINVHGKTEVEVSIDGFKQFSIAPTSLFLYVQEIGQAIGISAGSDVVRIGDINTSAGYMDINVSASTLLMYVTHFNLPFVQGFANNATALVGGLVAGDVYYTDVAGEYTLKIAHP